MQTMYIKALRIIPFVCQSRPYMLLNFTHMKFHEPSNGWVVCGLLPKVPAQFKFQLLPQKYMQINS